MSDRFLEIQVAHQTRTGPLDIDLVLASHPAMAISGGSTGHDLALLDLLAGFLRPDQGRIQLAGQTLVDTTRRVWVPPRRRRISLVPPGGALFPHLTVEENLAFAVRRLNAEWLERFQALVHAFNLTGILTRRPAELDARDTLFVAVARGLMPAPRLLLLHDPDRSLDPDQADDDLDDLLERLHEHHTPVLLTVRSAAGLTSYPRVIRFGQRPTVPSRGVSA